MIRLIAALALVMIFSCCVFAASASRTSGEAPLSVFFSADLVASTPELRAFHDYEYSWNFGDPDSGVWGTNSLPKNTDKGPVAAHVYESPGTYTAILTVRDSTGIVDTASFTITVADTDATYAGTKTTCISDASTNDFSGCPTGATQVATDNISNIWTYTGAGKRVLFRRGSSWTLTGPPSINSGDGQFIGAYGSCTGEDSQGICSNAPQITINGTSDTYFIDLNGRADTVISGISFLGILGRSLTNAMWDYQNILFHKVKVTGFFAGIETTVYNQYLPNLMDSLCVYSSKIQGNTTYQLYAGSERFSLIGNTFADSQQSHVVRVWQAYQGVISHNLISGASTTSDSGRHALKLHAPAEGTGHCTPAKYNGCLENRTEFVVVANNVFGGSGPWPVSIGPQDATSDERVSDVIVEKNKVLPQFGTQRTPVQVGLMFEGRYITARNNMIDGTGGANDYTGIYIARRGIEWTPLGNRVYNNTIYSSTNHLSSAKGIGVTSSATDTIVINNLVLFPNSPVADTIVDNSTSAVITNNVMSNDLYLKDPANASPLLRDFSLTAQDVVAIGQGATTPVFDDFLGLPRYGAMDIGAFRAAPRRLFRNVRVGEVEP